MAVTIRKNSRLQHTSLRLLDGVEFWDLWEAPTFAVSVDDLEYQVVENDRIDKIANRFYGDPIYWWVIAVANDMDLLPTDLQIGAVLRIPAPQIVTNLVAKRRNSNV